ncbi:ABC transporter ATP-binding protein [Allopusillimonas soli]|uniref:ABC transporter ATP-binding protein n=1 Tax=Allopusillimonas soli TaxID=659016 RepID=A0A853F7U7_9BURK|nr:ABC transporter ATP-binding protein [Allopusillimonas soli]NYT36057.1 ABC transporter ATP-binding protein [Allopusillimonas soli]TEA76396.1 ABC transporter ATP-binding protein [Allopusillimonas soli]
MSSSDQSGAPLLEIDNLSTYFDTLAGTVRSVNGVSYSVSAGETLGVVGESGCGKSVTALSVMRLVPTPPGRYAGGEVRYRGTNLLALSEKQMRTIRGNRISMIFQEPMTSLNPVLTIGRQIAETIMLHQKVGRSEAHARVLEMLELVQIAEPERRIDEYPHQLSGGMRQRVMIALALACNPDVLIADEPTTALDVTIQAQILDLLRNLQQKLGMGVIIITHDLGVVAECCDRVVVMYAGRKVEEASVAELFARPAHPYTRALLAAMPSMNTGAERLEEIPGLVPALHDLGPGCSFAPRCKFATERCRTEVPPLAGQGPGHIAACFEADRVIAAGRADTAGHVESLSDELADGLAPLPAPLLEVTALTKHYPGSRVWFGRNRPDVQAVDGISFSVGRGETLSLVGESGCGKSTTGKSILRLIEPTSGSIRLDGEEIMNLGAEQMRERRRDMQIIFQDPYASLNPRMTAGQIVMEPMSNFPSADTRNVRGRRERLEWLFSKVGLRPESMKKYPHEFSGGQRQRLGIARALALQPKIIVCDEPVSALDVSVQAQVINLLTDLQRDLGVAYLFVAHDLTVVRHISHRVAVMYLGHIMEIADRDTLFSSPRHPYTEILLSAVPKAEPGTPMTRRLLQGDPPSPARPPSGCRFHTRCPLATDICRAQRPELTPRNTAGAAPQLVACHMR